MTFGYTDSVKGHKAQVHGDGGFQCNTCGKSFASNSNLQGHIENVHEKLKKYKCGHCEISFGRKSDLKRHVKRRHN